MKRLLVNILLLVWIAAGVAWAAQSITVDVAHIGGKTYDSTAGNVAGTGVAVTGTWPKQTITVSGAGTGDVNGPSSSTAGDCANFGDTTGKLIADAGAPCGGSGSAPAEPQGRLTLETGKPVPDADEVGVATVYYDTSGAGNLVPVWNGSSMVGLAIGSNEISADLDSSNHTSGHLYDVFGYNASGSLAECFGPAWSSSSARGTGAGTTELEFKSGVLVNKNALTHCYAGGTDHGSISADEATYLGTVYATANGQTSMMLKPAAASGGSANVMGVCNPYNREPLRSVERDSTSSWSYSTASWRAANGSTSNRITFVDCLGRSPTVATDFLYAFSGTGQAYDFGVDLDSTTAQPVDGAQASGGGSTPGAGYNVTASDAFPPSLGLHYAQAMEYAQTSGPGVATVVVGTMYGSYLALDISD